MSGRRVDEEEVDGSLAVIDRRLVGLRRDAAVALRRYRAACAEQFAGRGTERDVERAEVTLAAARRQVDRAEAAAAHWRSLPL